MRRSTLAWWFLALAVGGATWFAVGAYGAGPLRGQAVWLGLIAAVAAYLARYIRLSPPTDRHSRSRASLTRRGKGWLLAIFGVATLAGAGWAVAQGLQGYTELRPAMLLTDASPPSSGFFIAEGRPQLEALYRLGGPDGDRFMAPLDTYEGRLLIIVDRQPPPEPVRVSGRLRRDISTVQTDGDGQSEGPFLPLYREHLRLPPNTDVYFLDTGVRAGLNLITVLMVLVPGYLFLLTIGAPTRRSGPAMRVPRADRQPRRAARKGGRRG